jgi:hypothetical protein
MAGHPWTHAICELCWSKLCKAKGEPGRNPVRMIETVEESCCFCGYPTIAGIYIRRDPALPTEIGPALKCHGTGGRHAQDVEATRPQLVLEAQDRPPRRPEQLPFTWPR